jgi:hypothetical protein
MAINWFVLVCTWVSYGVAFQSPFDLIHALIGFAEQRPNVGFHFEFGDHANARSHGGSLESRIGINGNPDSFDETRSSQRVRFRQQDGEFVAA